MPTDLPAPPTAPVSDGAPRGGADAGRATPTAALDYDLPEDRIAQQPVEPRSAARLLVATDPDGAVDHRTVADLPELLAPGDVLVVNDTRVLNARLRLEKATGGAAEVLLLEPLGDPSQQRWAALVRPGRRLPPGTPLLAGGRPVVEVGERLDDDGRRAVTLLDPAVLDEVGEVPLPPYVHERIPDAERYQTVYARTPGSVAAPTAGLHLDEGVLGRIEALGVPLLRVELAVGLGTFRPIATDVVEEHRMHEERYRVPPEVLAACEAARATGGRVVAVGTTSVRALESAASTGRLEGRTDLFITPGHRFHLVDVLLTNFHVPRSSLLSLLEAFAGPRWRELYDEALERGYRFLSFGDAMLVSRQPGAGAP